MFAPTDFPFTFGRYRIEKELGKGGMGAVYLAEDAELGRKVALKVPLLDSPEAVQRFRREARAAAAIKHPNVCPIHDIGCTDGVHYLTMPFVVGTPLNKVLDPANLPPPQQAVEWVRKMALALQALHERGLIHRDLKPSNVMLEHDREPILIDFGLARSFSDVAQLLTKTGEAPGTPAYMSPEQLNCEKAVGPATDIYSLGVILFELLTGKRPFEAPMLVFIDEPPKPSALRPGLDAALDAICTKALAKKPAERFASMADFARALERVGASGERQPPGPVVHQGADAISLPETLPAKPPGTPTPPVARWRAQPAAPRRSAGLLLAGVLTALVLLASLFLGWLLFGHRGDETKLASNPTTEQSREKEPIKYEPPPEPKEKARPQPPEPKKDADAPPPKIGPKPPAALPREITNSIGIKLVLIPAGKFMMGSTQEEIDEILRTVQGAKREWFKAELPQHEVEITKPFYLGVYEVTQEEYKRVMGTNPSLFSATNNSKFAGMDTRAFPVDNVSWNDAVEFCRRVSDQPEEKAAGRAYRLPTEAEWEYACREGGSSKTPFHFGRSLASEQANFDGNCPYGGAPKGRYLERPTAVDDPTYRANALGLYHMHGNVWEWCADVYDNDDYYKKSPKQDPQGPDSSRAYSRAQRGGSWQWGGHECRAAKRSHWEARDAVSDSASDFGFRVALSVRTP